MKSLRNIFVATLGLLALFLPVASADAQTVTKMPIFMAPSAPLGPWTDLGNGPLEIQAIEGQGQVFTASATGVGSTSGSSTALTLTASAAANPPCVGCAISGTGITAGTTVAAFNGTTGITLSAAMTVAASTALAWGLACPTSGAPNAGVGLGPALGLRGGVSPIIPLYTYARLCGYAGNMPGLTAVTFPIAAH